MSRKRLRRELPQVSGLPGKEAVPQESRNSSSSPSAAAAGEKTEKEDGRMPIFWRVIGGTIVSIIAMLALTVYQQFSTQINNLRAEIHRLNSEVRKDMGRLSESYGDLVKKDEHNTRMRSIWDTLKELRGDKNEMTILKERCAVLTEVFKVGEEDRRQLIEDLKQLREKKSSAEERAELVKEIRRIRERISQLEGQAGKTVPTSAKARVLDQDPPEEP